MSNAVPTQWRGNQMGREDYQRIQGGGWLNQSGTGISGN